MSSNNSSKEKQKNSSIETIRHSCAHVLAQAVLKFYPQAKLGIGPATQNGFYYDFDLPRSLTPKDLPKIEKEMRKIIAQDLAFVQEKLSADKAIALFKKLKQPYKIELIRDLQKEAGKKKIKVSLFRCGDFLDLCQGPHVKTTMSINPKAIKLERIAGAYWKGDEKNPQLQRIYGLAFSRPKELRQYEAQMIEAEKRDHRKIGKELDLFEISEDIGPGLILWLPKGFIIRQELEKWAMETEKKQGYVRVATPHITKAHLYEISGHLDYYKNDMYPPMKAPEGDYYLKPMNCPHHHMIFKARPKSYKDLPLRLAEYGTVYRFEKSGQLFGLMRVRSIAMNDAHIYCSLDQAKEEFVKVIKLHEYYYKKLGLKDYFMELCLRDPKNKKNYHGDEKMWQTCEKIIKQAMKESGVCFVEKKGEAAFYGPKIDFIIKSVTGREFAASTNQLDLFMGRKFGLEYIDAHGKKKVPAIIHRAPLGSHERFIGFLIEHFAGAFPVWLSPIQVLVFPVSEKFKKQARKIEKEISKQMIRTEFDDRKESVGKKISDSIKQKIPYTIVIGEKEVKSKKLCVRTRGKKELVKMSLKEFIKKVKDKIEKKSLSV